MSTYLSLLNTQTKTQFIIFTGYKTIVYIQIYQYIMFKSYQKRYPKLAAIETVSFTQVMTKHLFGKDITLYSSNPMIVEYEEGYLLHLRWINYSYHPDGTKKEWPELVVNLNSRCKLDKHFNQISEEEFLHEEEIIPSWGSFGQEDIRLFKHNDVYYYTATSHDVDRQVVTVTSGRYPMETFELPIQPILPSFYEEKRHEKNWAFVEYQNKLTLVYAWYPLQLTEIDYESRQLNRVTTKVMPEFFKDARGSTSGYKKGNEIWFVVHKRRAFFKNKMHCLEYHHGIVIFDVEMNLLRYSEWFTLGNSAVEFCLGLIVTDTEVILSYSLLDTQSFVSVYNSSSLRRLKWYLSQ